MVKVLFNEKTLEWDILEESSPKGIYLDGFLKKKLDNLKMIVSKGWDAVLLIDGFERSGKSTLGMTCGTYLSDNKLSIDNFASGLEDAGMKIKNLPNKSILIVDEGSLVFNSRDSMKKSNVRLAKILDVVGQKGLIFIIILPSVFNLVKDIAVRRSRFLLRVYTDEETLARGNFAYFGEKSKALLYERGKKTYGGYSGVKPDFSGKFVDYKPAFYDEYIELKNKSLMEALDFGQKARTHEEVETDMKKQMICTYYKNNPKTTYTELGKHFGLGRNVVTRYIKEMQEKEVVENSPNSP